MLFRSEAMMALLDTALSAGLKADYVLFDSWFSNPAQITAIHSKGMDVIASAPGGARFLRVQVPNPPGSGKDIAEGKGVHCEVESEGSRMWGTY